MIISTQRSHLIVLLSSRAVNHVIALIKLVAKIYLLVVSRAINVIETSVGFEF